MAKKARAMRTKRYYVRAFEAHNQGGRELFEVWCDSDGTIHAELGACQERMKRGEIGRVEVDETERCLQHVFYSVNDITDFLARGSR